MPFLLANWKLILLATLIASSGLFFKMWRGAVEDLNTYKIEVAAIGKVAEIEKERIEAEHAATTKEIKNAIPKKIAAARSSAVAAYLASLPAHSGSSGVSGTSIIPAGTDAASKEPIPACRPGFIEDAAQDAATIGLVQDWVRKTGIPIK